MPPSRRGVALVSTLLVLALVTILVVSFLVASRSMQASSSLSEDEFRLTALRDSAINTAIEQIRTATSLPDQFWTSQPGALRTYSRTSGEPAQIFKLYSSDSLTITGAASLSSPAQVQLEHDLPANWRDIPGAFVDLNEPVLFASDAQLHFPIVDPRLFDSTPPPSSSTPEGFSYSTTQAAGGTQVPGVVLPGAAYPEDQRLPMPVRWIYLLRDGSRGTLDSSGRYQPLSPGGPAPSRENPMVARLAFWTDDESAKLNINTASEPIPWDTPRAVTPEDLDFARHRPVKNEVQRFGGHPATTALSTVFFPGQTLDPATPDGRDRLLALYSVNPRADGGEAGFLASGGARRQPIAFKQLRLYNSVDELLLDPGRVEQLLLGSGGPSQLRRARFLLTATSQAPELTLAGTPRVSLWPAFHQDADNRRTAYDRLMTRAATIGNRPLYFRRNSPFTDVTEFSGGLITNAELGLYLMRLASANDLGYPRSFFNKYDGASSVDDAAARNMVVGIVSFMETLRQINLHDNTIAPNGAPVLPYASPNATYKGTRSPGQVNSIHPGQWMAPVNSRLSGPNFRIGPIARETVLSEIGFAFSLAAEHRPDGSKLNPDLVDALGLPQGFKAIQGGALFEGFSPGQGYTMHAPGTGVRTNLGSIRINGQLPVIKAAPRQEFSLWGVHGFGTRGGELVMSVRLAQEKPWFTGWGGSMGRHLFSDHIPAMTASDIARANFFDEPRINNFTTLAFDPITNELEIPGIYTRGYFIVPSTAPTMTLSSGTLDVRTEDQRYEVGGKYIYNFQLPTTTIPVPEEPTQLALTWRQRYLDNAADNFDGLPELLDPNDVLRTVVVRHGDYRLVYMRQTEGGIALANRLFIPHPDYHNPSRRQVHSFTLSDGQPEPGATFPRGLVPGVSYAPTVTPDFPVDPADPAFRSHLAGYPFTVDPALTRDWNNGTGIAPDGAYWTKADDTARVFSGQVPPYFHKLWDGADINLAEESIAPNQMVPSAVIFGAIPSLAAANVPWTTYLFRPDITPGGHIGSADKGIAGNLPGAPPDHRILDWFWMPVVQPYAISEPFSTAGKINLNHRLAPFGHIRRATGLHALLKSERPLAIPTSAGQTYKTLSAAASNTGWRFEIDADETLRQADQRQDAGRPFRFPSEICELFLVPKGETLESMPAFWGAHQLTGDNTLERPYAHLYPRLTTRSNAFRVHLQVQTISKARSSDPATFSEGADQVTASYRGEALVERYIDPNDPDLPDHVADPSAPSLDSFYQWRIRYIRRFAP